MWQNSYICSNRENYIFNTLHIHFPAYVQSRFIYTPPPPSYFEAKIYNNTYLNVSLESKALNCKHTHNTTGALWWAEFRRDQLFHWKLWTLEKMWNDYLGIRKSYKNQADSRRESKSWRSNWYEMNFSSAI